MKIWQVHYAFRPESPSVLVDGMTIFRADYGVYNPNYDHHAYRELAIIETDTEPFNRGLDDQSVQYGPLTVDGLTFEGISGYANSVPMIQISDNNPTGSAVSYFRGVRVIDRRDKGRRPLANVGGGTRTPPTTPNGVPIYLLDYFGPGRHARVVSTRAEDLLADGSRLSLRAPDHRRPLARGRGPRRRVPHPARSGRRPAAVDRHHLRPPAAGWFGPRPRDDLQPWRPGVRPRQRPAGPPRRPGPGRVGGVLTGGIPGGKLVAVAEGEAAWRKPRRMCSRSRTNPQLAVTATATDRWFSGPGPRPRRRRRARAARPGCCPAG